MKKTKFPFLKENRISIDKPLDPVIPNIEDWPIHKEYNNKDRFIQEVIDLTLENSSWLTKDSKVFRKELKNILYQEKIRLTQDPWKSDDPKEKEFWKGVKKKILATSTLEYQNDTSDIDKEILLEILNYYGREMTPNFKIKSYNFVQKVLPFVYARLMSSAKQFFFKFFSSKMTIYNKMKVTGDIDLIRDLSKKGTVVVVPTHFSNLDSPTIGLSLSAIGLSAFTYGAGVNLFTLNALSRLMNNLGAYRVDRRRKHRLYLDFLKNYSTVAMRNGVNSLFFPGGTRSRSGALEGRLKLGLLGTTIKAQRLNLDNDGDQAKKIFVVPATLNYHYILEAESLINQHLKQTGKEEYIADEVHSSFGALKRAYKVITANSGMVISFAPPMDVLGNRVDKEGNSINKLGKSVDVIDYFTINKQLTEDAQRDQQYTQLLGDAIVEKFKTHNMVLSSHIVAFVAFQILRKRFNHFSIYEVLRLPKDETTIPSIEFEILLERVRDRLFKLRDAGEILLSDEISLPKKELIVHGIKHVGSYHPKKVLKMNRSSMIYTESMKLLYFYHNRLTGYELEEYI